jgi:hypothetical protein
VYAMFLTLTTPSWFKKYCWYNGIVLILSSCLLGITYICIWVIFWFCFLFWNRVMLVYSRLAWKSLHSSGWTQTQHPFCLSFPNSGITIVYHHTQLLCLF